MFYISKIDLFRIDPFNKTYINVIKHESIRNIISKASIARLQQDFNNDRE